MRNQWAAVLALALAMATPLTAMAETAPFRVSLAGYAALAPAQPSALGTERTFHEKDVVYSMPLAWEDRATVAADITIHAADADWKIHRGDALTRARSATGGDLASLPAGAVIYCGDMFDRKGAVDANLLTLGLASVGSRLATWLQLCVVDGDADGQFEKAFLVGTKRSPDRVLVDIDPVAYAARTLEPIEGGRLDIVYFDGGLLVPPNFELQLYLQGRKQDVEVFSFPDNAGPPQEDRAARKAREQATPSALEWFFKINTKALPQTFTVGNGHFTVRAVDGQAKTATVAVDRDPTPFPFSFQYRTQTIYVYVYTGG